MSLSFTWLGVAGVILKSDRQVLAIDPFFTRPTVLRMLRPLSINRGRVADKLPVCDFILVTHAHYDHLMDVPEVIRHTGATAYGSANTCAILQHSGISSAQANEVRVGNELKLGEFEVEVVQGRHSSIPFGWILSGKPGAHPPRFVWDFRMDTCLGYGISTQGVRILICSAEPHQADVLFAVAQEPEAYYRNLLEGTTPHLFVPIHWDNFTRPLSRPLKKLSRPGRKSLSQLEDQARSIMPGCQVIIPEIFREYTLDELKS